MMQVKIDAMFDGKDESRPKEFSRAAIVHATTQLVACGDLVRS